MSALRSLAEREATQLRAFRDSDQAALMIRLVHTECLLELARLSGGGMDMASYAGMVVDVIEAFLPVRSCRVRFEVEGLPAIEARRAPAERSQPVGAGLALGGYGTGSIELALDAPELGPPEFVEAVAEQVASGLLTVVETERLRRQAALADTARLTSLLADAPSAETLELLVEALAYLPNVLGVALEIVHSALGAPVSLSAGLRPDGGWENTSVEGGSIRMAARWADTAPAADRNVLTELVEEIAKALGKAEDRRRLLVEAQTDPLTGVANRRQAMQALEMAVALAKINNDVLTVACFDLDKFKQVNDRFGHAAGDQVLVKFAAHLRASVRRSDTVARIGGEEFLLICPGLDEHAGQDLLEEIVGTTPEACRSALATDWAQTTSAGLAVHPVCGSEPDQLLRAADGALYSIKHDGGNAVGCAERFDSL
ncbi:MAG: GGDEF domain-containing protein [Actinomycetota bacterium]|nr:GGDEF domain-containing protein [Actinomycetota bacterium]